MDWQIAFIGILFLLFLILFLGEWIAFALGATGLIGLIVIGRMTDFSIVGYIGWNMTNSFELTAIPMFIFMGEVMVHSGLSRWFYDSASVWFGRMPGGLLQTNVIACAIFAAISGSSPATAAAIGSVAYPEMKKRGYDKQMTVGSLLGGGALGILIPPSIPMVIYGAIAQVSVAKLFMAGIVPGIVAVMLFCVYITVRCLKNKNLTPPVSPKISLWKKIQAGPGLLPFAFLICTVLGTIYLGWATPTESAALGTVISLVMSFCIRGVTWNNFKKSIAMTVKLSTMILMIVIGAQMISYFIAVSGISRALTGWIVEVQPPLWLFFALIIVVYLILGCIMDGTSMLFLTVPILLPILDGMNIDLIWFGLIVTIMVELGQITPPVGLNLYVLKGISGTDIEFGQICRASIPYCVMYLMLVLLIMVFPVLALWLPGTM
jgi:tripartite ATP-independent transporter DctM subunit